MRTTDFTIKYGRWLSFLGGCILFGCMHGPQQKGIWPWEYGKETGNYQTGDYITVSGKVGHFGEAPKSAKPIIPETLDPPHAPESLPTPGTPLAKSEPPPIPPAAGKPGSAKAPDNVSGKYDFTVDRVKVEPPSYMPMYPGRTTYDITAFNHGIAPVSVTIGVDPDSSENLQTDKNLPFNAVVPPNTDQTLVHFGPKIKNDHYNFRYMFSWSIGDYRASHNCPEHYRLPFGNSVRAFANMAGKTNSTPFNRYSVIFSVPAGTPVLAARKGKVVQIKGNGRIDIFHDDSTIATYSQLGTVADGLFAGKAVTTGDVIGLACADAAENPKEAFVQLTVWRPEPLPNASLKAISASSGFEFVSFPLKFCITGPNDCRVLTQAQWVSKNKATETRKQAKHRTR